jgi:hypothetical protein
MPTYDYCCDTNGRVLEVNHRMSESLATWGELCARAGIDRGDTPIDAPVHRLATGGNIISSTSQGSVVSCRTSNGAFRAPERRQGQAQRAGNGHSIVQALQRRTGVARGLPSGEARSGHLRRSLPGGGSRH